MLDGAGNDQCADTRLNDNGTGDRVLRECGGGDCDLTGIGCEQAGGGVISVVYRRGPGYAIEGYHQIRQNGIEGISDDGIVSGNNRCISLL